MNIMEPLRVCVLTTTRADFGIMRPLIQILCNDPDIDLRVAVTGTHLSEAYGMTVWEIRNAELPIDAEIQILEEENNTPAAMSRIMARALTGFSEYFDTRRPDLLMVLGDRYEVCAICAAATNARIPIAHLHGGEATEGLVDECFRHSISKMSYLHFTSCEAYRRRVIQLGESPERVFNVGALGVENARKCNRMTLEELEKSLDFSLRPQFAVVTFHPVTLEDDSAGEDFSQLLDALDAFPDLRILFTKSNADTGGLLINQMIDHYVNTHQERCTSVFSLGMERYMTALQYASAVIGNSSSGILETPSFCVPTVNIGDRQKMRIQAKNILNCEPEKTALTRTISRALSDEFREFVKDTQSPYGDGEVSSKILSHIKTFLQNGKIDLKKSFYNIDF